MKEGSSKSIKWKVYLLWAILAFPVVAFVISYLMGNSTYGSVMHGTGEFAARFLVIALIATPISMLFPKAKFSGWLLRNRRFFGVAAFVYTFVHALFYVLEESISTLSEDFFSIGIFAGWVAFIIFIPLAMTSTDAAIKRMGKSWKKLQRWVYLAAFMSFLHWALIDINNPYWAPAFVHFGPVIILSLYRIWHLFFKKK